MKTYGILVVDDSAVMRKMISAIIESSPNFYVIGKARNGADALEKVARLKPDLVTLDIEMPEMDGLQALKMVMEEMPIPVVMLSNEVHSTVEAMNLGAVDFIIKNELIQPDNGIQIKDFHKRLLVATTAKLVKDILASTTVQLEVVLPEYRDNKIELLVIGSSTGGPSALQTILTKFPQNFPVPVLIIQHMPPGFTKPLAMRFDALSCLKVKEAEHNEIVQIGTVYIAPAGIHTTLEKNECGQYVVKHETTTFVETLYKPSIDVALLSIAKQSRDKLLTVILTGMGDDGLKGCKAVKQMGGTILAEAEESCVVYGMPKVVVDAGLVDKQLPLATIFDEIMSTFSIEKL